MNCLKPFYYLIVLKAIALRAEDEDALFLSGFEQSELQFDLPVQDPRVIIKRDAHQDLISNASTASPFIGGGGQEDWIEEAVKDVAYYLRDHKFNEFDRRYIKKPNDILEYHKWFPRPPLRNLHWEVQKYCADTFLTCLNYLWRKTREADSRRTDDTSVVIHEQKWDLNNSQVRTVDDECRKLKIKDNILANPFQGPLERFQWRTTASYFMCWFVMNDVEDLRHLTENCDNFANCLDRTYGPTNRDFRANDDTPYACALYSFCPDPCCEKRVSLNENDCWSSKDNPCYAINSAGGNRNKCVFQRKQNRDFHSIILNQWNVTCECPLSGHMWDSKYGSCVDVDECFEGTHTCKNKSEACLNLKGAYKCVCKWGHTWNKETGVCTPNVAVSQIKLSVLAEQMHKKDNQTEKSLIRRFYKYAKRRFMEMATSSKNVANVDKNPSAFLIYCCLMSMSFPHFHISALIIDFFCI